MKLTVTGILALAILFLAISVPSAQAAGPNSCVGIASDSNGFGHVTFEIPTTGDIGIIYVRPLAIVLDAELHKLGLAKLRVQDHSLSAGGLTASGPTGYLASSPYGALIRDRCQFVIAGPFIPDIAAAKATPDNYINAANRLINGLIDQNPNGVIFFLNFYQTDRAQFTRTNNGFGLTPDRIQAFNDRIATACRAGGTLARYSQVICVNVQPMFAGMDTPYVLATATQEQYRILFYRNTGFMKQVDAYFTEHPDGQLIGDGIHLSYEGRVRLMQRMAQMISRLYPL
jgi:hypothetical protein